MLNTWTRLSVDYYCETIIFSFQKSNLDSVENMSELIFNAKSPV